VASCFLRRSFDVDVMRCPKCGSRLHLLGVINRSDSRRIQGPDVGVHKRSTIALKVGDDPSKLAGECCRAMSRRHWLQLHWQ
jgi:hypothetical protein